MMTWYMEMIAGLSLLSSEGSPVPHPPSPPPPPPLRHKRKRICMLACTQRANRTTSKPNEIWTQNVHHHWSLLNELGFMIVILHKVHMIQSTVTHSLSGPFNSPYTYRVSMFTQRNPSRIEIGHDWLNCVSSTPPIRVDNSKRSKGKEESFLIQTYILVRNKGSYPHRKSITVSRKCIPHQHCFQLKLYLHIRVAKHGGEARYITSPSLQN